MTRPTEIDRAHAAMEAAPADDAARLRFYAVLADAELLLLLEDEPADETLSPLILPLEEGRFVMAFDTEERLAEFTGAVAPYAALPGRVIAAQLAGQGVGLGLNLGVAPSAFLMPPGAVDWLTGMLAQGPVAAEAARADFMAPDLPDGLRHALADKIARLPGQAAQVLVAEPGGGWLLAFVDAVPGAEPALAKAVSEALAFSGLEEGVLDVTFLAGGDPRHAALARVALALPVPAPAQETAQVLRVEAPGMDPARPPRLK